MDDNISPLVPGTEAPALTEQDSTQEVPVVDRNWRDDLTDEQIAEIRERATALLKKHPVLTGACLTMQTARQLYNLATYALHQHLERLHVRPEEGVEACLIDSMAHAGMQAFSRDKVLKGLKDYALPFAMAEYQQELAELAEEERNEQEHASRARKQQPVPISFPLDLGGATTIVRDRPVILGGSPALVSHLLDKAVNAALLKLDLGEHDPRIVVLRLANRASQSPGVQLDASKDKVYVTISINQWIHCASNLSALEKFLGKWVRRCYRGRVDLLVVDDLTQAQKPVIHGQPAERIVAEAQRCIRRWAEKQHCAFLGGFPYDEEPDYRGEGWKQLEVYTDLRVASTRQTPDQANTDQVDVCLHNPFRGVNTTFALFQTARNLLR
jgi:hypothetical protein